jgi:hypothetical protein
MKTLVLLLVSLSFALQPQAVLAPGQGDAAAAVAAHGQGSSQSTGAPPPVTGFQLMLSGSAKMTHLEGGPQPGAKPFKNTINFGKVLLCIQHDPSSFGCDDEGLPENDVSPGVYLNYISNTQWVIADNPAGDNGVTLNGLIDGKGGFMMSGTYSFGSPTLNSTSITLTGKVKFRKGTFEPLKISGKLDAVSVDHAHYGSGSFHSTSSTAN